MKTFIKYLTVVFLVFTVIGCNIRTEERTNAFNVPKELSDCKIYSLGTNGSDNIAQIITVVRCPNSSTTTDYKSGKSTRSATVLD